MADTPQSRSEESEAEMVQRYTEALNDRKLLSVHEAGHAAVAEHLNMGLVQVVVRAPNTSCTETHPRNPSRETLREELVMALAGHYAVLKESGDEYIAHIHSGVDRRDMFDLFKVLSIKDEEQKIWMKEARPITEKLIDEYWSAIKKIADVLFQNGQMTGEDVRKVLSDSLI